MDITDPQILKRAALVPLITTYGRLDVVNIESTAGRLAAATQSFGSVRSTWTSAPFRSPSRASTTSSG